MPVLPFSIFLLSGFQAWANESETMYVECEPYRVAAIVRTWRFVIEDGETPVLWLNDTPIELTWEQAEKVEQTIVALRENSNPREGR